MHPTKLTKNTLDRSEYLINSLQLLTEPAAKTAIEEADKPRIARMSIVHLDVVRPKTKRNWQNKLIDRSKEVIFRERVFQAITNERNKTILVLVSRPKLKPSAERGKIKIERILTKVT
jgi:hypothetical protein